MHALKNKLAAVAVGAVASLPVVASATPATPFEDVTAALVVQGLTPTAFATFAIGLLGFFAVGLAVMVARRSLKRNTSTS